MYLNPPVPFRQMKTRSSANAIETTGGHEPSRETSISKHTETKKTASQLKCAPCRKLKRRVNVLLSAFLISVFF